jgi:hypothetical protein
LQAGELSKEQAAKQAILDILMLSQSDLFVLHLASNFSRIAFALAVGRLARVPPFVSLDGPFCNHWQLCCEVQKDGDSAMC